MTAPLPPPPSQRGSDPATDALLADVLRKLLHAKWNDAHLGQNSVSDYVAVFGWVHVTPGEAQAVASVQLAARNDHS